MKVQSSFLQGLTDAFILTTIYGGGIMLLWVLIRMGMSRNLSRRYLQALPKKGGGDAFAQNRRALAARADLPLFRDFDALLIEIPRRDGSHQRTLRRCGDAAEVFNDSSLAHGMVGNRLFLAVPGILTGLGVLGTFVGLQLGIGSLDLNDLGKLDQSIKPLIQGCSTAFSTSVWGVVCSLAFIIVEKFLESFARSPIRRLQERLNGLLFRYTPEESMVELQRSSEQTESILKGLAVAIGEQMQTAMNRLGGSITEAVRDALGGQAQDLGKMSADLMSQALSNELAKLQEAVTGMAERFGNEFNGASKQLHQTVAGFEPVVKALGATVNTAQATVREAVDKLNAHEGVMTAMVEAAKRIDEAADKFAGLRDSLETSGQRNLIASEAQQKSAESNVAVAEQYERIGERLPELRDAIEAGAQIIGSLGQPMLDVADLLRQTPDILKGHADVQAQSEELRTSRLLAQTESLANAVAAAAGKFAEVETLGKSLADSARALEQSGLLLSGFNKEMVRSIQTQSAAAAASEKAAVAGQKAAESLQPIPEQLAQVIGQLTAAGSTIKDGAVAARDTYTKLAGEQRLWLDGVSNGLGVMRDRLNQLIKAYGDAVEGDTKRHMDAWTSAVEESLNKFSVQVQRLDGAIQELTAGRDDE